jgi:hypothetical protein
MFSVVPVIVTDVAPPPNVQGNTLPNVPSVLVNTALVQIKVPPTEIFICLNVAVLELQKLSVVDALACVNAYTTPVVLVPGLLNVTV